MHAHDGGTEPAFCLVPRAVEGSTPQPVPSGLCRLYGWQYDGRFRDRPSDGCLDRMGRDDSVYGCIRGQRIREAVKGVRPGLLIADQPRLHDLSGPALAERASLHGRATLSVQVTGHTGSIFRGISADGSKTDLEDRYLELFCLAKPIVALSVLARSRVLGIDVDAPLRSHLVGILDADDEVTVATLLCHGSRLAAGAGG